MSTSPRSAPRRAAPALLAALFAGMLAGLFLPACGDNPACLFGPGGPGGCLGGGSDAVGDLPATFPGYQSWLRAGEPRILSAVPDGEVVNAGSPVVIVFSESMQPQSVLTAFQVVAAGGFPTGVPTPGQLVGDGRVLVLQTTNLDAGVTYEVQLLESAEPADLSGTSLEPPPDGLVARFSTDATPEEAPAVLATWPMDGTTGASPGTEIVVVFDRPVVPSSIDATSVQVTVDGMPPAFDPAPVLAMDSRIVRYFRRPGGTGPPQPFEYDPLVAGSGEVTVELSGDGVIEDADGDPLPLTTIEFTLARFGTPADVTLLSEPADAIGVDALSGPADLMLSIDLADPEDGDVVGLFVFGSEVSDEPLPETVALYREYTLTPLEDPLVLDAADLDLTSSTTPLATRLADGTLSIAVFQRRGDVVSAAAVLDVDPDEDGIQPPVQDTVPPTLVGVGAAGKGTGSFTSELRDVVLVGRADEELRAAQVVVAGVGDNLGGGTELPPTAASSPTGLFVARPVPLPGGGIADPGTLPLMYEVTVYDRALNASTPTPGVFVQRGAVTTSSVTPPDALLVSAFDAATGLPVEGALVLTYDFDGVASTLVGSGTTGVDGRVEVDRPLLGEPVVVVDAAGYDLFGFQGGTTNSLGVPLQAREELIGSTEGRVTTDDPDALNALVTVVDDTRTPGEPRPFLVPASCELDLNTGFGTCEFGPAPIAAGRIGAQSFLATQPPATLPGFSAASFLRAFELAHPVEPSVPPLPSSTVLSVDRFLSDVGVPAEEEAQDAGAHMLDAAPLVALATTPTVRVEGLAAGVRGPLAVGRGLAFGMTSPYPVRGAYAGEVEALLVPAQAFDADLFLRADLIDDRGNTAVVRPVLTGAPQTLVPLEIPRVVAPAPGGSTGGASFDLVFTDVVPDGLYGGGVQRGLYLVTLVSDDVPATARGWQFWRTDPPDLDGDMDGDPETVAHLPDLALGGATPLPDGTLTVTIEAFAWPDQELGNFLWTDRERREEHAARLEFPTSGVPLTFVQGP